MRTTALRCFPWFAIATFAAVGCSSPNGDDVSSSAAQALAGTGTLSPSEILGSIACGGSQTAAYTGTLAYGAYSFAGTKGQAVTITVGGAGSAKAEVWLLRSDFSEVTSASGSPSVALSATLPKAETYYVAFRNKSGTAETFAVGLGCPSGSDSGSDSGAAPRVDAGTEDAGADVTVGCASGEVSCGGACASVLKDPNNCGACGIACPSGDSCTSGVCACPSGACTTYDTLPVGSIALSASLVASGTLTQELGANQFTMLPAQSGVSCQFTGSNPGTVVASCALALAGDVPTCSVDDTGNCTYSPGQGSMDTLSANVDGTGSFTLQWSYEAAVNVEVSGTVNAFLGRRGTDPLSLYVDDIFDQESDYTVNGSGQGPVATPIPGCIPAPAPVDPVCTYTNSCTLAQNLEPDGHACTLAGSSQAGACLSGTCCASGDVLCSGQCADLSADANNCGACGTVCSGGLVCSNGTCSSPPPPCTGTVCDGACVDTSSDENNCGGCGKFCYYPYQYCGGGTCQFYNACAAEWGTCTQNQAQNTCTVYAGAFESQEGCPFGYSCCLQ